MKQNVSLLFAVFIALVVALPQRAKAVVTAGDYYIVNDFFDRLLTCDSTDTSTPRLVAYSSANDAKYIFTAEASGTTGYVKLKQKSTGLYLTASTSNNYSVLLSSSGSGDQYLWAIDQRFSTTIVSKKNTSARLGCDFYSGSTYYWASGQEVPVYYNKSAGAMNWFTVIPATGDGFEASRTAAETTSFTNEYGVTEQDDYQVSQAVEVSGLDYHIISSTPFATGGSVNLNGTNSWLVFENVRPSSVISNQLSKVTIDGATAVNGTNCRVEIWLKGAVVIPTPDVLFTATAIDGSTFTLPLGNNSDLGENSNKMVSFTLKRGYMATVASGTKGGDYSRVYVADHADLTVTLPQPLTKRVSSVYIRKWHYTSKSGYAGGSTAATIACGGTWYWNWDANSSSSTDLEYIPIKQHLYWPSDGNFYNSSYTAMMMFNEPEHSEQHTSSKCSCGGTISAWTAYTQTSKFNATGLRIGSPSATDLSYIKEYLTDCDNMKQRCDFACTHGYWTTEWASNLSTLKGYGRPVWITEWEYGASWTTSYTPSSTDEYAAKVLSVLDQMEYSDYVERYSYYPDDLGGTNGWERELFWDNTYYKGTAPAGTIYKKVKPHFGYTASIQPVPNWWVPSVYTPAITDAKLADGIYTLTVTNKNADCTGSFEIQVKGSDGTWSTLMTDFDRSVFETSTMSIQLPSTVAAGDIVRVVSTTLYDTSTSLTSNEFTLFDYRTLETMQNLRFDEGTYVSKNVKTYAKDVSSTSTETSQLQTVTGWDIVDNGDARSGGQYAYGASYYLGSSGYTCPATNSEGTTDGGALGVVGVWTGQAQYNQHIVLPRGSYTLTVPVYNSTGGTTSFSKNLIGFVADDGTEYLATAKTYAVGTWTTETITFSLLEETPGYISVGYTAANSGSSAMPHLFIDYVDIQFAELNPNYDSMSGLQNLRFDVGAYQTKSVRTYEKDIADATTETAQLQEVTGWTIAVTNGDAMSGGQFQWNDSLFNGGTGYITPTTSSEKDTLGGCLGLVAVWSATVQYKQAVTLPVGHYTITIPVYNMTGGTTSFSKNLIGFIADSGTEYLATKKTYTVGAWTTETISFTLSNETPGYLSLGYTAANSGSSAMPHLYVDYVQIECDGRSWPLVGDASGDGIISLRDVPALIKDLLDGTATTDVDDYSKDGKVTTSDVNALVNVLISE